MDKLITQGKILDFMRMLRVWVVKRLMLGPLQYFTNDGLSMGAWSITLSEGFLKHCLGDGRVFEMFFLGMLPWVFQIGGMASKNIVKCSYL